MLKRTVVKTTAFLRSFSSPVFSAFPLAFALLAFVASLTALPTSAVLLSGCAGGESENGFATSAADSGPAVDDATTIVFDDGTAPAHAVTNLEDAAGPSAASDDVSTPIEADASSTTLPPAPPFDAGDAGVCTRPLAAGDLAIVELMVESTSGTGDHGEWIEITSMLDCAMNVAGLSGNTPTGAKVNTFTVMGTLWIPPKGTLVVADSSNFAVNHGLPGLVIPWEGQPGDVLRNDGATITLVMGGVIIDSVTYPKMKLTPGVSIAFPHDCAPSLRIQWSAWQESKSSWFPGFSGSPNAPNDDVQCPIQTDE